MTGLAAFTVKINENTGINMHVLLNKFQDNLHISGYVEPILRLTGPGPRPEGPRPL